MSEANENNAEQMASAAEQTQAVVEVSSEAPPPNEAPDLGSIWFLYAGMALVFLVLLYRWMRRWPKWLLVPVWSAFAAGALTPAQIGADSAFSAPAAIVAILGAEQNGITGFLRGALPILMSFVAISFILSGVYWWLAQRQHTLKSESREEMATITEAQSAKPKAEPKL